MADITNLNIDTSPFTVRKPKLTITHIGVIALLMCFILFIFSAVDNWFLRLGFYILVSGIFGGMIYLLQNKTSDEKTATEFQALVFSGSMRCNTLLTVILYQDGSIFYLDPRYAMNFEKGNPSHNLEQFLSTIGLPNGQRTHIYDSVRAMDKAFVEYTYLAPDNKNIPLKITLTPLARPSGFVNLSVTATQSS